MSGADVILGVDGLAWQPALSRISAQPPWKPFDPRAVRFVTRLSQALLTTPALRPHAELVALGHWFRGASLNELEKHWSRRAESDAAVVGRGMAFHIAPANVDSIFMYSWMISLLAGNTNVVRVSQKRSEQQELLYETLRLAWDEFRGDDVVDRLLLLTYGHDDTVTSRISALCQLRVVWGGDETVRHVRALPLSPTALELCFPDRFSLAAVAADAVLALDEEGLERLARNFYNDTFWFGQQACSSPRMLVWVGGPAEVERAQSRFWRVLYAEVERKAPLDSPAMKMTRLVSAYEFAAEGLAAPVDPATRRLPERLAAGALQPEMKTLHRGLGLFLEQRIDDLAGLAGQLSPKEQTLTVFGFDRAAILGLVDRLPARAIDRIVPVGEALSFTSSWDGMDLLEAFTRRITLPKAS